MEKIERKETWEEFVEWVKKRQLTLKGDQKQDGGWYSQLLFRGQSDANWKLETTLDRFVDGEMLVEKYYNLVHRYKPQIEMFTGRAWEFKNTTDIKSYLDENHGLTDWPDFDYLVFLRHFGFPSPLLDWSASPYVAAFFAYENARPDNDVAIYCYLEHSGQGKSWMDIFCSNPTIHRFP